MSRSLQCKATRAMGLLAGTLAFGLASAPFAARAQNKAVGASSATGHGAASVAASPSTAASSARPSGTTAGPITSASAAAPAPSTTVAPSPSLGTAGPAPLDGATYSVRLRDLEQRINELKEQVRRTHTRLALLSESILSGITAASRAEVVFQNEMSSAFRLKRIVALYDGAPLTTKTDERDQIGDQKEIPLYAELVQPGDHTLQVLLEYQGNGYGIFSYLKGYKFEVRSSRGFTALEGRTISLRVVGYEQGGPTTPFEERPAVRYVERVTAGVGAGVKKPETK